VDKWYAAGATAGLPSIVRPLPIVAACFPTRGSGKRQPRPYGPANAGCLAVAVLDRRCPANHHVLG